MSATETEITLAQLSAHNTRESLWIGVHGQIYDLTTFSAAHPGGIEVLVDCAGTDGSEVYDYANHSEHNMKKLQQYRVGPLAGAAAATQTAHHHLSLQEVQNMASKLRKLSISRSSLKRVSAMLAIPALLVLVAFRVRQKESLRMEGSASFWAGMAAALAVSGVGLGYLYKIFLSTLDYQNDISAFPPTVPRKRKIRC